MSREERLYLEDIRCCCEKIERFTRALAFETFCRDERTYDAVLRNLTVIGEAVKNLSADLRNRHPAVDWRKIAGLRDIVMDACFGVDAEIVWDLVESRVPELRAQVERILAGESAKGQ